MNAAAVIPLEQALPAALAEADAAPSVREAAQVLRSHFPALRVVVVDSLDMREETPAAVGAQVQLFYAASDGHCWQVTQDATQVAGLFISERS